MASTSLPTVVLHAQKEKMKLLNDNNITIYRCHDLWDLYPKYGVRDQWAKTLGFDFDLKKSNKFLCYADNINLTTEQLAHHVIKCIKPYYQFGIELIGNKDKVIKKVGIGTGACTDIFEMYENNVDACIVSDDGINNWVNVQVTIYQNILPIFNLSISIMIMVFIILVKKALSQIVAKLFYFLYKIHNNKKLLH